MTAVITGIDSSNGGDANINYKIEFNLKSYLPDNGAILI